jgi:HSP20 family protein
LGDQFKFSDYFTKLILIENFIFSSFRNIKRLKTEVVKKMNGKDSLEDMREMVKDMLEDTARTVDKVRFDIEKSIVDYTFLPGKDIIETDDSIIVNLVLPGIKKEDVKINLTENKLKVKAKFEFEQKMGGSYVTLADRRSGMIRRTVRLPKKVIVEEAKAEFKNGILKVEIPKQEKEEGINIEIE